MQTLVIVDLMPEQTPSLVDSVNQPSIQNYPTDLPNTHSQTLPPHHSDLAAIIITISVVVLLSLDGYLALAYLRPSWYVGLFRDSEPNQPSVFISPSLTQFSESDLPPLYPGLGWEATESGEFEFVSINGKEISMEGISVHSKETSQYPNDFIGYYFEELKNRGWQEVLSASAGGPGGEDNEFYKNGQYIKFGTQATKGGPVEGFQAYKATITYTAK